MLFLLGKILKVKLLTYSLYDHTGQFGSHRSHQYTSGLSHANQLILYSGGVWKHPNGIFGPHRSHQHTTGRSHANQVILYSGVVWKHSNGIRCEKKLKWSPCSSVVLFEISNGMKGQHWVDSRLPSWSEYVNTFFPSVCDIYLPSQYSPKKPSLQLHSNVWSFLGRHTCTPVLARR